jgi:hypothetical protein
VAREVLSVGTFQLDLRFWGRTSLDEGGRWHFFRRLRSEAGQPFSPAVVINGGRYAPAYEIAAFRVLVDEEESAWRGGLGKFDSQGGGVYSAAHFPPRLSAGRPGEEGGE